MKNLTIKNNINDVEIPPFDFENSTSNKFASLYTEDNTTIIYKSDKIKTVVLDVDIAKVFKTSSDVNNAFRAVLSAIPKKMVVKV